MPWFALPTAFGICLAASFLALSMGTFGERRRGRDADVARILAALPGHDCGLCGFADCRRFARALASREVDHRLCAAAGEDPASPLARAMGAAALPRVAFVRCGGGEDAGRLFDYEGAPSCALANRFFAGGIKCAEACLGFGDCVSACPIRALRIEGAVALVDPERCNGCGLCAKSCPKGLITLVPRAARWQVACSSRKRPEMRAADCDHACTACGACLALSAEWQFTMEGGLARATGRPPANGESAAAWEAIARRCPTGAIHGPSAPLAKKREETAS